MDTEVVVDGQFTTSRSPADLRVFCPAMVEQFAGFWFKGQHMSTGRCPVKRYNRHLRDLTAQEKV